MDKEIILKKLVELFVDHMSMDDVDPDSTMGDNGADSLDTVDMMIKIERDLGVGIPDELGSLLTPMTFTEMADALYDRLKDTDA